MDHNLLQDLGLINEAPTEDAGQPHARYKMLVPRLEPSRVTGILLRVKIAGLKFRSKQHGV